jgi:hypothetical protein
MKVLVIPDIHLKPYIFTRAKELLRDGIADTAVCLMDIPDDWRKQFLIEEYAKTYDAAIEFAKEYPHSLWTYGNHDLSYLWDEKETGYSPVAKNIVCQKLMELSSVLKDNNSIRYVQRVDNILFCHGGISRYFVEKYVPLSKYDDISYVVDTINSLGHYEMWCDDSPIWYRPQYYKGKMYKPRKTIQIVGHTPMEKIEKKGNVISCDVFSTYQDGRPIGTQEFVVIDTESWAFNTVK